jgi:hypothetical protein
MAAFVLAALVAIVIVPGWYDHPFAASPVGQAEGHHALGSRRAAVVRGELPGTVDARAGVCNVPGVPRGRRAGDDCVLDKHEVTR